MQSMIINLHSLLLEEVEIFKSLDSIPKIVARTLPYVLKIFWE